MKNRKGRTYIKKNMAKFEAFGWNFPLSTDPEIGRNEDSNWHFLH